MNGLIVFACLLVVVNSVAVFRNGECLNPDPCIVNRGGSSGSNIRSGNYYLDKLEIQLANISQRLETLEHKHNKEDNAELVRQIGEAQNLETHLRSIKCEFFENDLKVSSLEEKYKLQYETIFFRMVDASEILNTFIVRMKAVNV